MAHDPTSRICGVCGRVLEQHGIRGLQVEYRHSLVDEPADHAPIPVHPDDIPGQVRFRCDFCLAEPITHTLVVDKELGIPSINVLWDTEWAMCAACTECVVEDRWIDLRQRVFDYHEGQMGPLSEETKIELRIVHRDLRKHAVLVYAETSWTQQ